MAASISFAMKMDKIENKIIRDERERERKSEREK